MTINRTVTHALILWLVAFALMAAGIYLSQQALLDDRNWLARAGCLIVILGIWSGVGGLIEERLLREALAIRRRMSISRARYRYRDNEEERNARLAELNERYDKRLAAHSSKLDFTFGMLEGSLLVTGTLVWGFGDLLQYFF